MWSSTLLSVSKLYSSIVLARYDRESFAREGDTIKFRGDVMIRLQMWSVFFLLFFSCAFLFPHPVYSQALPKPNIVVILTDDQRWDTVGRCLPALNGDDYGSGANACMPNLELLLMNNGVVFKR